MYDSIDYDVFPQIIVDYLHYMIGIKNKSSKTVYEYSINLKLFSRYMAVYKKKQPSPISEKTYIKDLDSDFFGELTLADGYAFLSYCKEERNNSAATRSRKVAAIRSFYHYLSNRQIVKDSPLINLDTPKQGKKLPKYLTLDESLDLLKCIDGKNKERDYAIITLFLNCGIRLSELVGLNCSDIKDNGTMVVTGKGNKQRTVYLNNACITSIRNYMRIRPVDGVVDKNALFLSSRLKRISPKTVQYTVKQFLKKAGLEGYSVHKLRHTAATLMYQYGNTDLLVLKEILGHENVGTTQIYTHIVSDQLEEAAKSNPLANIKASSNSDDGQDDNN